MFLWAIVYFVLQNHLIRECLSRTVIVAHEQTDFNNDLNDEELQKYNLQNHPCQRPCKVGASPMNCHYTFTIESYYVMSKACFNCPYNITDCFRPHCISSDGVKRSIIVVNRQLPGPSIEVCQGDRIIVDVTNALSAESTTVHWHGQHQYFTPYMDGVPYLTQCPIPPGNTFRYQFIAENVGTQFWHSHIGLQRGDGFFGPLIVRIPLEKDPNRDLYDYDDYKIVVTDWIHESSTKLFLAHYHSTGGNKIANLLINGLGRFQHHHDAEGISVDMPTATFTVKQNFRYRFRLINAEFLNCPIELSVDDHIMYIISTDGNDVDPIETESLVSYAGERFDFIIEMDQEVNNYWMRFRGLMDCDERFKSVHQVAVLRYEGAPKIDPASKVTYFHNSTQTLKQVNALNKGIESEDVVSIVLLESVNPDDETLTRDPDHKFYISYDFYNKDNPHFFNKHLYSFHQVKNAKEKVFTPQLNHISLKLPTFPLLSQRESIGPEQFCNSSTVNDCEKQFCTCTHVLQVKLNSVVELIIIDEGVTYDANHPFHLHGHNFRVVGMERLNNSTTLKQVKRLDEKGLLHRNLKHAPLKDTVAVPDGGYTIIRFHANNPGFWLFHCHIEFHSEIGMALIFKVGEYEDFRPVPPNFPRCGNYLPSNSEEVLTEKSYSITSNNKIKSKTTTSTPNPNENEVDRRNETDINVNRFKSSTSHWMLRFLRELRFNSGSLESTKTQYTVLYICFIILLKMLITT